MKTFLTATSLKKVVLLDYLLESGAWCSTKELAKVIGVTDKSILNYLEEFKQLFKSTDQKIRLFNDHNKNFRIIKEEDFPIYTIYLKFYQASYNYKLIDFMYHNPHQRLADYADSQFTSISTVFRYAKLLKSYFKRYKIQFLPYKLELKGDEINIRSFYYYFYWNSTREMRNNWPFNTELAKLDEYIANFEEIYGISLDPLQRKKFAYWLAITLERSQIAPLNMKIAKKQIIDNDPNFDLMWQWNKKGELTLNQDELYFLYQVIYVFGIIDGNPNYENSYASAHQKNQTHAYQAVMNLALVIKKTFNFQLGTTDLELMFNFIAFHERSTFFYGNSDVFFSRSYITELKEEHPRKYQIMQKLKEQLVKHSNQSVTNLLANWEQLFLNYYFILDYYDLFAKKVIPVKILVQDDLHHTHRLWLMNKIRAYFGHPFAFEFYDYKTPVSKVDLVISNYYIDTKDCPLILMKNLPTERNWRQLGAMLYRLTK